MEAKNWENWSGGVNFKPAGVRYPASQAEIVALVKECRSSKTGLRVVGSGHSFTPLVETDGFVVSLDKWAGVEEIDRENYRATVRAGTKLKAQGELLYRQGMAQPSMGDIDAQSIAGAISTGTHGTGINFGIIPTQVVALTLVTADGEVIECSEEQNREIFKAAQVSLGALGIITRVTLQLTPLFRLHSVWKKMSLANVLADLEKYKAENRHFEFFWFPYSQGVQAKFKNTSTEKINGRNLMREFNDLVVENGAFWLLSEASRINPAFSSSVSKLSAALISDGSDLNYGHRIFATSRLVKFEEMEYAIPAEAFKDTLREIDECIRRNRFKVHFPVECRFVKADDIYLSPAYGRDSAFIAVHMYKGMEYRDYFAAIEEIFKKYEGRPHWGKRHTLTAADFSRLYPRWQDFQAVRQKLDPTGFFLNQHLRTVFGN